MVATISRSFDWLSILIRVSKIRFSIFSVLSSIFNLEVSVEAIISLLILILIRISKSRFSIFFLSFYLEVVRGNDNLA